MIFLTFQSSDGLRLGIKTGRGVIDVKAAAAQLGASGIPQSPEAFYRSGLVQLDALADLVAKALNVADGAAWLHDESTLTPGPLNPAPGKILCVGVNYRAHAAETGHGIPQSPVTNPLHDAPHASARCRSNCPNVIQFSPVSGFQPRSWPSASFISPSADA